MKNVILGQISIFVANQSVDMILSGFENLTGLK
jgi:hypothetical protein